MCCSAAKCKSMKIHAITYGRSVMPQSMVIAGGDPYTYLPIGLILYVIELENRWILIDAGCDTLPGFDLQDHVSPAQALRNYGIEPNQITDVIITHAHHDHVDGVRYFPRSRIYMQVEEYRKGKRYIPENAEVHTFTEECIVADCIHVTRVGGHSAGSSIATVQAGEVQYVFGADECYLPICLEKNIPTGVSSNPQASRWFVSHFSDARYRVLLSHDPKVKTGIIFSERN